MKAMHKMVKADLAAAEKLIKQFGRGKAGIRRLQLAIGLAEWAVEKERAKRRAA